MSAARSLVCLIPPVDKITFLVRKTQNLGYEFGISEIVPQDSQLGEHSKVDTRHDTLLVDLILAKH